MEGFQQHGHLRQDAGTVGEEEQVLGKVPGRYRNLPVITSHSALKIIIPANAGIFYVTWVTFF